MTTHLTSPPPPRRTLHVLACVHCQTLTDCAHDAVRVVCPACTATRLGTPGPLLPPHPHAEQLGFAEGGRAA